jgi:hypothetical protein
MTTAAVVDCRRTRHQIAGFVFSLRIRRGRGWLTTEEEAPDPLKEADTPCAGMSQGSGYLDGPHVVRSSRRGKGSRLG